MKLSIYRKVKVFVSLVWFGKKIIIAQRGKLFHQIEPKLLQRFTFSDAARELHLMNGKHIKHTNTIIGVRRK